MSRANITPEPPMYLAGYGGRSGAAEGKLHDIWVKVLALEGADGHRGVVITSDVCGVSKATYDRICAALHQRCRLERSQIQLTYSHTHTGPALDECLQDYCDWDDAARARIKQYTRKLESVIVDQVAAALENMSPATVWAGEGTADFAVNRRENREAEVSAIRERGEKLKGPVDHTIPVLAVKSPAGKLKAVLFGYACHTTTLSFYRWSGDYAGFAMIDLEKQYPEAQAMFFQGCGADQNPLPRRSVELCRKYGRMLSDGVQEALADPLRRLEPTLDTAHTYVELEYEKVMTREDLEPRAEAGGVYGRWAKRLLAELDRGAVFPATYAYAVQAWKLGDQLWITLAGEAVVGYSLKFRARYGPHVWVSGFAHELTAYIPSRRVWEEGGYEGGYLGEYGHPAMRWKGDLEDRVTAGVEKVVGIVDSAGSRDDAGAIMRNLR